MTAFNSSSFHGAASPRPRAAPLRVHDPRHRPGFTSQTRAMFRGQNYEMHAVFSAPGRPASARLGCEGVSDISQRYLQRQSAVWCLPPPTHSTGGLARFDLNGFKNLAKNKR